MNEIFTRVSIRKYQDKPVEDEKITQLLRAAMAAPSAGNQQPWEFFVVKDKEKIARLSEISPYAACAKNAPLVIVPCYRTKGLRWGETALIDLSCATENLLLEIDSLGLGGVWLCAAPLEDRMEKAEAVLGIGEDLRAFAVVPVGYPAEEKSQQDRFEESRVHYL
ncbi:nitroreductase family protein [Ruminococcus sp.]|uniref:nitroreductase family protein n=1 Tax=Ruminococcus sp. TaxID=41978 RepID=UPI0025F5881E|nr:nitroreductase family protein [Ruminococcus sp.]MBQ8966040.1 nitroreductase family protein [Ruminococcus sp.]